MMVTDRSILEQALKSSGTVRQTPAAPCHSWDTMRAFDRSNDRRSWWKRRMSRLRFRHCLGEWCEL